MNKKLIIALLLGNMYIFAAAPEEKLTDEQKREAAELEQAVQESKEQEEMERALRESEQEAYERQVTSGAGEGAGAGVSAEEKEKEDLELAKALSLSESSSEGTAGQEAKKVCAKVAASDVQGDLEKLSDIVRAYRAAPGEIDPTWYNLYSRLLDSIESLPESDQEKLLKKYGLRKRLERLAKLLPLGQHFFRFFSALCAPFKIIINAIFKCLFC